MFLVNEKDLVNKCLLFHLVLEVPGVSFILASLCQQYKNICDDPEKLTLTSVTHDQCISAIISIIIKLLFTEVFTKKGHMVHYT